MRHRFRTPGYLILSVVAGLSLTIGASSAFAQIEASAPSAPSAPHRLTLLVPTSGPSGLQAEPLLAAIVLYTGIEAAPPEPLSSGGSGQESDEEQARRWVSAHPGRPTLWWSWDADNRRLALHLLARAQADLLSVSLDYPARTDAGTYRLLALKLQTLLSVMRLAAPPSPPEVAATIAATPSPPEAEAGPRFWAAFSVGAFTPIDDFTPQLELGTQLGIELQSFRIGVLAGRGISLQRANEEGRGSVTLSRLFALGDYSLLGREELFDLRVSLGVGLVWVEADGVLNSGTEVRTAQTFMPAARAGVGLVIRPLPFLELGLNLGGELLFGTARVKLRQVTFFRTWALPRVEALLGIRI